MTTRDVFDEKMLAYGVGFNRIFLKYRYNRCEFFGMAQKPPVLVNIMRVEFYPDVLPFRHEYYDSIAL